MNNTGIPLWVFQGICLSRFIGDVLQPAKIIQHIKQHSIRQPVLRKITHTKGKKNAGEDTCTTRISIPSCVYKSTEREPWKGASLGEGNRGFADPQSPSYECEWCSSSAPLNLGKWQRGRAWRTTPPTYFLSVYPCLAKETIISQFFINVIENILFKMSDKERHRLSMITMQRNYLYPVCVVLNPLTQVVPKKATNSLWSVKNAGLKQMQLIVFIQRQHRK